MKKLLSLILVLVFALTGVSLFGASAESTYTQPEKFIYGDVDLDGDVTVKDATLIQKYVAQLSTLSLMQKQAAHLNEKQITIRNATEIQKYLAKIKIDNSNVGITSTIESPTAFKKTELNESATGDEIPFAQTEYTEFNISSESSKYYSGYTFFVFTTNHYTLYDLEDSVLANRYTDEYFEDNALIIMSIHGSSSIKYRIDNIKYSNDKLNIDFTRLFPDSGAVTDDIVNNRVYIELNKTDIENITQISAYQNIELY